MKKQKDPSVPPRWASRLLRNFVPSNKLEDLEGDLLEMYSHWIRTMGVRSARQRYIWSVLRLLKPFNARRGAGSQYPTRFSVDMVRNSVRITRRGLVKNWKYAAINLSGLTLGLTVCIFIYLFVKDELSYDRYLAGEDRVVRIQPTVITGDNEQVWATSEGFVVPAIASHYPEIEAATRFVRNDDGVEFSIGANRYSEYHVIAADSTFFDVFPFPFAYGERNASFTRPDAVVISQKTAKKLFGNINPVGKVLNCFGTNFTLTGVFKDIPANSHFNFEMIFPLKYFWDDPDHSRNMFAFYSYLRLRSPGQINLLSGKLLRDEKLIYGNQDKMKIAPGPPGVSVQLHLIPVSAIHLTSKGEKEFAANGNLQVVYIFIAIACLILVIVVINYINLSNAMALKRWREVGIRKAIGDTWPRLMVGFMLESYMFTAMAFLFSLALVILLMPWFGDFSGKQFDLRSLFYFQNSGILVLLWLVLGFLAGIYPAAVFSSVKPSNVVKAGTGIARSGGFSLFFRRGLLVFQFMVSFLLIVCTVVIRGQMHFIETMDTGFNRKNVLVIPIKEDIRSKTKALKSELAKLPEVEGAAFTSAVPGKRIVILSVRVPELAGSVNAQDSGMRDMRVMSVDADFIRTLQIPVLTGRDFSMQNVSDANSAFILNEAAVKELGLKNPVGSPFEYTFGDLQKGHVIGVVKDFNFASVRNRVEPLMLHIYPWYSSLCIRLNTGDVNGSIQRIERVWKSFSSTPFEYSFLDASYAALYRSEQTASSLITYMSFLALLFACIGLFGVVSFFIQQRTKEVGIRKLLGAPRLSLLRELSKEYIMVVIVGNILALYPAWYFVTRWLENFTYRISLSAGAFLLAFGICLAFACGSILRVIIRIARTNPAVVLRNE